MNSSRSMNSDLRKGAVEGKYKFARPNTGGDMSGSTATEADKATLHPDFGYSLPGDAPNQMLPDGTKR